MDIEDDGPAHAEDDDPTAHRADEEFIGTPPRDEDADPDVDEDVPAAEGPVHRPLIRATLPRPEGQKDARPVPDFTIRQAPSRGNGFGPHRGQGDRGRTRASGSGNGNGNVYGAPNGNRAHYGGGRFNGGGNRPAGQGRPHSGRSGGASGFRNGNAGPKRGRGPRG